MSAPPTALIVDDSDDIRALVTTILARAGFTTRDVDGAAPALVAAADERPNVYVLDVRMPGMNGLELCRRLKADERTTAPVLLLSAESAEDNVRAGYEAGCDAYLSKPFRPRELLETLGTLVGSAA